MIELKEHKSFAITAEKYQAPVGYLTGQEKRRQRRAKKTRNKFGLLK